MTIFALIIAFLMSSYAMLSLAMLHMYHPPNNLGFPIKISEPFFHCVFDKVVNTMPVFLALSVQAISKIK